MLGTWWWDRSVTFKIFNNQANTQGARVDTGSVALWCITTGHQTWEILGSQLQFPVECRVLRENPSKGSL